MVHVLFTSEEWHDYPKDLEDDREAWLAANPPRVQYGPFDRVEVRCNGSQVLGFDQNGEGLTVAETQYDEGWILFGHVRHVQNDPRKYDHFEIVGEDS